MMDMSRRDRGREQLEGIPDLRAAQGITKITGAAFCTENIHSLEANLRDSVKETEHEDEGIKR